MFKIYNKSLKKVNRTEGVFYRVYYLSGCRKIYFLRSRKLNLFSNGVEAPRVGNTKVRLTFFGANEFLVEADIDCDGAYDDYSSGIQLWPELSLSTRDLKQKGIQLVRLGPFLFSYGCGCRYYTTT